MTGVSVALNRDGPMPQKPGKLATVAPPPEVADLIVAYLEQLGVEYVFGVPGGAIEPLYNSLARSARLVGR